jgi:hypothetical protein
VVFNGYEYIGLIFNNQLIESHHQDHPVRNNRERQVKEELNQLQQSRRR